MSKVIKVWTDLLCSNCYRVLKTNIADYSKWMKEHDDNCFCEDCHDWVFPIVVTKQEFDLRLVTPANHQAIESAITHGWRIIHIDGEGITHNLEQYPTGTLSKTIYAELKVK